MLDNFRFQVATLSAQDLAKAPRGRQPVSLQGVKMGRPSYVHISIGVDQGEITQVQVGGESVLIGEGTLYIP